MNAKKEDKRRWDRAKPDLIGSYLRRFKLDESGDLKEKAERLEAHFATLAASDPQKKELLLCQIKTGGCGFKTPRDVPECAFCGDKDTEEGAAPPVAAVAAPAKDDKRLVQTKKNKPKKEQEEPAEPPAPEEREPAHAPEPGAAIQKSGPEEVSATAEKELDEACARIHEIRQREVENMWDLGHELVGVYDRRLYLQRRDPATNAPLYKSFGQFVTREFGFSDVHCFRMMDVAREFDRPTATRLGVKKAHLLHLVKNALDANTKTDAQKQAAAEKFSSFVEAAEKESFSEIEQKVRPIIAAGPTADRGRGKGGRPKGGGERDDAKAAAPERITCALELGKTTIPLLVHGTKDRRAKKLSDGPFGVEELVNGVLVRYEVRLGADGFLELLKTVRRPS